MEYIMFVVLVAAFAMVFSMQRKVWRQRLSELQLERNSSVNELQSQIIELNDKLHQLQRDAKNKGSSYLELISETLEDSANSADVSSADLEQVITGTKQVSENLDSINDLASATAEIADSGINKSQLVEQQLTKLNNSQSDLDEMLSKFNEINEKTEAIRYIGEEAEMLALNAAIEAARAGEAGRGFAVVADNMKELAKKSQISSSEILNIVEKSNVIIQDVTDNFSTRGNALQGSVSELVQSFNGISQQVTEINSQVVNVDANLKQKLVTAESVSSNVKTSVETLVKRLSKLVSMLTGQDVIDISPKDAKNQWQKFDQVIDVRRETEWNDELGHIPHITFSTLQTEFKQLAPRLDPNKTYLFVCRSGGRSTKAAQMAMAHGVSNVYNLEGGMLEWRKQGL